MQQTAMLLLPQLWKFRAIFHIRFYFCFCNFYNGYLIGSLGLYAADVARATLLAVWRAREGYSSQRAGRGCSTLVATRLFAYVLSLRFIMRCDVNVSA